MRDIEGAIRYVELLKRQNTTASVDIKLTTIKDILEKAMRNNWILVGERLPTREEYIKNDGRFIVTDGNRVYQSLFDIYEKKCFIDLTYKGNCEFDEQIDNRVIAWQVLPEYVG